MFFSFVSIDVDKIDTYACSVPDVMAEGGTVTDAALEASGSVVMNCINRDKKMRKRRRKAKQAVPVSFGSLKSLCLCKCAHHELNPQYSSKL